MEICGVEGPKARKRKKSAERASWRRAGGERAVKNSGGQRSMDAMVRRSRRMWRPGVESGDYLYVSIS